MSLVAGLRSGIRSGLRSGLNPADDGLASVTRDAGTLNYYPATAGEWTLLMAVAGLGAGPSSVWTCQEATAPLIDSVGSITLTLTGTAPSFLQPISGAARSGVRWAAALATSYLGNVTTAPTPIANSYLLLCYLDIPAAGVTAELLRTSVTATTNGARLLFNVSGVLRILTETSTLGTISAASTTGWIAVRYNITAGTVTAFSQQEKFSGGYNLPIGTFLSLGGSGAGTLSTSAAGYAYACLFSGTAAEMTDAQVKILLQTLGATIPWS